MTYQLAINRRTHVLFLIQNVHHRSPHGVMQFGMVCWRWTLMPFCGQQLQATIPPESNGNQHWRESLGFLLRLHAVRSHSAKTDQVTMKSSPKPGLSEGRVYMPSGPRVI